MTLWQRFVEVNRPGPPEDSVSFRAASVVAVLLGIGACWSEGLLSPTVALFAAVATVVGNLVAYLHRADPWPGIKPILAVCAVGGFVWFILTVTRTATPGDISTVEAPLAVLFAWVLSTHAFDVPSRRDVTYSLAGSTALVAVAAAQSVDLGLGVWVLAWVACCVWGLVAMWQSLSETAGVPWRPLVAAGALVAVVAVLVVAVLPAPKVSASLDLRVGVGCLVPRRQPHRPHRRRQLAARPRRQPRRTHRRGRVPGLRQVPRHRRPGDTREPGNHAGPGHPPELLGRPDLRPLERPVLGAVRQPGRRAADPEADGRLAVHHPDLPGPGRRPGPLERRTSRPSSSPPAARTSCSTPTTPSGSTCGRAPST